MGRVKVSNSRRRKNRMSVGLWRKKITISTLIVLITNTFFYAIHADHYQNKFLLENIVFFYIFVIVINLFAQPYILRLIYKRLKSMEIRKQNTKIILTTLFSFIFPVFGLYIFLRLYFKSNSRNWNLIFENGIGLTIQAAVVALLLYSPIRLSPFQPKFENKVFGAVYYSLTPSFQFYLKDKKDEAFIKDLKNRRDKVCAKSADQINCIHKRVIQRLRSNKLTVTQLSPATILSAALLKAEEEKKLRNNKSSFVKRNLKLYTINQNINQKIDFLKYSCHIIDFYDLSAPYGLYTFSGSIEHALILGYNRYISAMHSKNLIKTIDKELLRSKKISKSKVTYNTFREKFKKVKASKCIKQQLAFNKFIAKLF